jgi:hypothetical protein
VLPVPDKVRIENEDKINDQEPGPLRYAYPVQVNFTVENSGSWQTLNDGGKLWTLNVKLPGALSTNAMYDKFRLPKNLTGVTPYYLGWDRTGNSGTGGIGIHHPAGDVKKISLYTMSPESTDYLSNTVSPDGNHWRLVWSSGTTEIYSSGSPLINNSRHVIGQLHGGYVSCNNITQLINALARRSVRVAPGRVYN